MIFGTLRIAIWHDIARQEQEWAAMSPVYIILLSLDRNAIRETVAR
jgi:hypothetical protein